MLTVRVMKRAERKRFGKLEGKYHYLGETRRTHVYPLEDPASIDFPHARTLLKTVRDTRVVRTGTTSTDTAYHLASRIMTTGHPRPGAPSSATTMVSKIVSKIVDAFVLVSHNQCRPWNAGFSRHRLWDAREYMYQRRIYMEPIRDDFPTTQDRTGRMKRFGDGRDWFFEKRFGFFVHWGLYAVNAWHEQEAYRRMLPRARYAELMACFNPAGFNPDAWLDLAQEAGMEYVCFTAKHCDGFCMWDTRQTDFKVTRTPFGKDVLTMLADACQRRGFPLCLYYSVPDMHCPQYPHRGRSYEYPQPQGSDVPDLRGYLDYVRAQVRELCTGYGPIAGFWWDVNTSSLNYREAGFNDLLRQLQPGILINDRGFDAGDFSTPEREAADGDGVAVADALYERPVEACESIGCQSWGYRSNEDYHSLEYLTQNLAKHLAKGGNYLLNAGPDAGGGFGPSARRLLTGIGDWLRRAGRESLWQVDPVPVFDNSDLLLTGRGDSLYVHFPRGVTATGLSLYGITQAPRRATLLTTNHRLHAAIESIPAMFRRRHKTALHLSGIPVDTLAREAIVVKLEFDNLAAVLETYRLLGGA
jgi:alpha-L-fucosidase